MKRLQMILLISFMLSPLCAESLRSLIDHGIKSHPTLQALEQKLQAVHSQERLSTKWPNPTFSFAINDIRLDRPLDRTLEPMQFMMVSFLQPIPRKERLEALYLQAKTQADTVKAQIEAAKISLLTQIKQNGYLYRGLLERKRLIRNNLRLQQEAIKQLHARYEMSDFGHLESVNIEVSIATLKQKLAQINAAIKTVKARLSYLSNRTFDTLKVPFGMPKLRSLSYYRSKLEESSTLRVQAQKTKERQSQVEVAKAKRNPDWFVKVDYASRVGYNDYLSIGAGVKLPIYGKEDEEIQKAKIRHHQALFDLKDTKAKLHEQILRLHAEATAAKERYNILKSQSLPAIEHMLDLSGSSIESGGDPVEYIKLMQRKLAIEEEMVLAQVAYLSQIAQLDGIVAKVAP